MKVIEKINSTFWKDVARNCSYATFFHTRNWAELMSKTFSYIDITKGFIFDDGTRAVFPFMKKKSPLLKGFLYDYISGPSYVYGGPISDGELNKQKLDEIIEYIISSCERYHKIIIRGNPFGPNISPTGFKEVGDLSHIVKLFKYNDEKDFLKILSPRTKSRIRRAQRSNVKIVEGISLEEYEKLYEIYKISFKYWGDNILTNYPITLFRNAYNLKSKFIKLWTASYNGEMIGGNITLYWNDYCQLWHSYHNRQYSKLFSARYLLYRIFCDCIEKGIKYFDFRQSGGIKGVEIFKKSMGGKEYNYSAWVKENDFLKKARYIKKNLIFLYKKVKPKNNNQI